MSRFKRVKVNLTSVRRDRRGSKNRVVFTDSIDTHGVIQKEVFQLGYLLKGQISELNAVTSEGHDAKRRLVGQLGI